MTNSGRPSFVGIRECKLNRRPKLRRRPRSTQFEMLSKYTILVNASAKSPTSVNALAGNGVGHPVPERMVWKSNPLIVGSYKMLSREEMSIQTRLTGHVPFSESKMCPPTHPVHELAVPIPLEYTFSRGADDPSGPLAKTRARSTSSAGASSSSDQTRYDGRNSRPALQGAKVCTDGLWRTFWFG
jgi:hypothetical protein